MSKVVIRVENVSKQYKLGAITTGTLSHDLNRWWHELRGKEDPYLKIGETNDRTTKSNNDYVWALKDINFEVSQGEVLGIIGKNGAGKSTLLKILSRTTSPTTGTIKTRGRIASLLEVGTGFHPELTGRENIFLNGAILGMTKAEIKSKFDEIVDFSGVEKYIDTPVKRYSSGMYVRLAFAVAAHLEPEILIVDEVLAVGDAEFQRKAIGKMKAISSGTGRTVLFVSHNMASMKNLCDKGLLLKNGGVAFYGSIEETVNTYLHSEQKLLPNGGLKTWQKASANNSTLFVESIHLEDSKGDIRNHFQPNEDIQVHIKYSLFEFVAGLRINILIKTAMGDTIFASTSHEITKEKQNPGRYELSCVIPKNLFHSKSYIIALSADIPGYTVFFSAIDCLEIRIEGIQQHGSTFMENWHGMIAPVLQWSIK